MMPGYSFEDYRPLEITSWSERASLLKAITCVVRVANELVADGMRHVPGLYVFAGKSMAQNDDRHEEGTKYRRGVDLRSFL
jgi:hypothetical protein